VITIPWILNEDAALKKKLQGITVFDANAPEGGRVVPVRYRGPEDELIKLTYPGIYIEMQGIYDAPERQSQGILRLPYAPEGQPVWWDASLDHQPDASNGPYRSFWPYAFNLDYRVTLYTRLQREHNFVGTAQLLQPNYMPSKYGFLDVPQDGTRRSMWLQGGPDIGYGNDEDGKRLFRSTFLVRIPTELVLPLDVIKPGQYPLAQLINLYTDADAALYYNPSDLTDYDIKEAASIVGSYSSYGWNVQTSY
jgi:hypothetical protein